jgi:CheY-like chemotaxis protein
MKNKNSLLAIKRLHIFIADDDPDDLDLFKIIIRDISSEIKITVARNGVELLEFLEIVIPDIIFLDINMPGMNGIDCLSEIRKQKKLDDIPVIMFSTTAEEKHVNATYALGANLYLQKPAYSSTTHATLYKTLSLTRKDFFPPPPISKYLFKFED